ncbi:hypothetical protein [Xenorhabdus littoralis]|uniref:hypothetical protein n=1 Tax=Xenorhabdus littoralis TaxID=2582835 RepID=UPI0029E7ECFD|nr:hypothetical protein [Xenorhabdus sp. psl]MDX7992129.1 hypothetical protein [Xenorhabdus sp. psl]
MNKNKILEEMVISELASDGTLSISVETESFVFINQELYVNVKAEKVSANLLMDLNLFTITPNHNSIYARQLADVKVYPNGSDFDIIQPFVIRILTPDNNNTVSFKINAVFKTPVNNGKIPGIDVSYTIIKQQPASVFKLSTDDKFIEMPETDNFTSNKNSKYISYSGKIIDTGNNVIPNALINISTVRNDQLTTPLINITDEPEVGKTVTPTPIYNLPGMNNFFTVKSDSKGYISFRAYPIKDKSGKIDFTVGIPTIVDYNLSSSMFIYPKNAIIPELNPPTVFGMQDNGIIEKLPEDTTFSVNIESYNPINNSDTLIFFIAKEQGNKEKKALSPTYSVDDSNKIEGRSFKFTYDQLLPNQDLGLSYMVVPEDGTSPRYSSAMHIKYPVDENSPDNKDRIFEKIIIYSTSTEPEFSDKSNIVDESSLVMFETISKGVELNGSVNNGKAGLYPLLKVAKDQSTPNLPQIGQSGSLRISATGKSDIIINFKIDQAKVKTDQATGTQYFVLPVIPFCDLKWIDGTDDVAARLYIDYTIQTGDPDNPGKSKLWGADIDTVIVGDSPDNNYGCI